MTLNGCSKKLCPLQVGTADNCNLTKEQCPYFTQDIDYRIMLKQIKAEVAREIIGEILLNHTPDIDGFFTMHESELAELKKKYIGE